MEYKIGDSVMHWSYGLGQVVGIEERGLAEQKMLHYAIAVRNMTLWVPIDEKLSTRLRRPTPAEHFQELFDILIASSEILPGDRQERKVRLVERLKDGQASSLCSVLRDLFTYKQTHPLNNNDLSLLKRVRESLVEEWSHAFGLPALEAEARLHQMLGYVVPEKRSR